MSALNTFAHCPGASPPPAALPYEYDEEDYAVPEHVLHVVHTPTQLGVGRASKTFVSHFGSPVDIYLQLNNFATVTEFRDFNRMKSAITRQSVPAVPVLPVEGIST